jgi:hypothetical protein
MAEFQKNNEGSMEVKQCINICVQKGEFSFTFCMPLGCTWGNALDAAFEVAKEITELSNKSIEDSKPKGDEYSDAA